MIKVIPGLEDSFDNEKAEQLLETAIGKITYTSEILKKSMYDFDLESPEGIEKLMALLPIMDPEILVDIMGEIWPGYPTEVDARRHRLEIKGYLKDYLLNNMQEGTDEIQENNEGTPEAASDTGSDGNSPPEKPGKSV